MEPPTRHAGIHGTTAAHRAALLTAENDVERHDWAIIKGFQRAISSNIQGALDLWYHNQLKHQVPYYTTSGTPGTGTWYCTCILQKDEEGTMLTPSPSPPSSTCVLLSLLLQHIFFASKQKEKRRRSQHNNKSCRVLACWMCHASCHSAFVMRITWILFFAAGWSMNIRAFPDMRCDVVLRKILNWVSQRPTSIDGHHFMILSNGISVYYELVGEVSGVGLVAVFEWWVEKYLANGTRKMEHVCRVDWLLRKLVTDSWCVAGNSNEG